MRNYPRLLNAIRMFGFVATCLWQAGNGWSAVTFSVSPATVSNTYAGVITVNVGGLNNGEAVQLEKYIDANTNGLIDAADLLVQSFQVTDGQADSFFDSKNGIMVTNFNVPGDWNTTNGIIGFTTSFANSSLPQRSVARFIHRLRRGDAPVATNFFTDTNGAFPQSFSGTVRSSGTNVPYAGVLLFMPGSVGGLGWPAAGVMADSIGKYKVNVPPGNYLLIPFKSNYLADAMSSPIITLNEGLNITTNLSLYPTSRLISGRFVDASNTNIALPGLLAAWVSTSYELAVGFTGSNGDFAVPVSSGIWQLGGERPDLDSHGYVGYNDEGYQPLANTAAGNVTGIRVKFNRGTALAYGRVINPTGQPLAGASLYGCSNNCEGEFAGDATVNQNGWYAMPLLPGSNWNLVVETSYVPAYWDYLFKPADASSLTLSVGEAYRLDFLGYPIWYPFIGQPARLSATQLGFTLGGAAGTNYTIQACTNLSATNWFTVLTTNLPASPVFVQDDHATNKQRFYRVMVGP